MLDTENFEPNLLQWLAWYRAALVYHWPQTFPYNVGALYHMSEGVWFQAPEVRTSTMREAWCIYLDEGDTDVGRAAVMLTCIIAATVKPRAGK